VNFDPHQPHGIVIGEPGVAFQQNGQWFRKDGSPVESEPEPAVAVTVDDPPDGRLRKDGMTEDDLRRPENQALKTQLDLYGEPWTTRKAAQAFLERGRQ
jgi:hypothetical protein